MQLLKFISGKIRIIDVARDSITLMAEARCLLFQIVKEFY
jgi:hypothetical protein